MKQRFLIVACAAQVIAGCAIAPPAPPPPIERLSTLDICYALVTGRTQTYGNYLLDLELRTRGEDCNKYNDMMAIRIQADAQQTQANAQRAQANAQRSAAMQAASEYFLRRSQPTPMPAPVFAPAPTQINCTTVRNGMFTHTNCN